MRFALNRYQSLIRKITVRVYKQTFTEEVLKGGKNNFESRQTGKSIFVNYEPVNPNDNEVQSPLVTSIFLSF